MRYLIDPREMEKEGFHESILGNSASSWEAELAVMYSRSGKRENGQREEGEVRKRKAASLSRIASREGRSRREGSRWIGATRGLESFLRSFLRRLQLRKGRIDLAATSAAEEWETGRDREGFKRVLLAEKRRRTMSDPRLERLLLFIFGYWQQGGGVELEEMVSEGYELLGGS